MGRRLMRELMQSECMNYAPNTRFHFGDQLFFKQSIGVKYSSVACTGHCKLWFHAKCAGLSNGDLRKLLKAGHTTWKCNQCKMLPLTEQPSPRFNTENILADHLGDVSNDSFSLSTSVNSNSLENEILNSSIKTLENSLVDNNLLQQNANEDDKLTMAAKIGSALLEENKLLNKRASSCSGKQVGMCSIPSGKQ
ncbi:hypothetical protein J6590_003712 [Homalodisca vitripennis]|nr:hypothetical protein J6590_003712 [Homalodisca vitripennis]